MNKPRQLLLAASMALLLLPAARANAQGQGAVVSGHVVSVDGQPLRAANVVITELNVSAGTTETGAFTIRVPADRVRGQAVVVRARSIGFRPDQRVLTIHEGVQTVDFALETDVNRLEEIVVTGVTTATSQRDLAFTVAKVDVASMFVPAADPLSQLAGKVPGMQVVSFSGRPGAQPDVLLRGPKSINASERGQNPLYIVDGVIINGALFDLNSLDIESIEVVKGAAAASFYGSRAGSGVIQITTKRGRTAQDGVQFRSRAEVGQGGIPGRFPLARRQFLLMDESGKRFCVRDAGNLDCARSVDFSEEALRINQQAVGPLTLTPEVFVQDFGIASAASKVLARGLFQINPWPETHDAIAAATRPGSYASENVDASGRSGTSSFFASMSNFVQEAPLVSLEGARRQSLRVNVDNDVDERWSLGFTTYYSQNRTGAANVESGDALFWLTRVPAIADLTRRDSLGRLFVRSNPLSEGQANANPLYKFDADQQTNAGDRFIGDVKVRYMASQVLTVEGNLGFDKLHSGSLFLRDRGYRISTSSAATVNQPLGFIQLHDETQAAQNGSLNVTATHTFWNAIETRWNTRYLFEKQQLLASDQSGEDLVVPGLKTLQAAQQNVKVSSSDQTISATGVLTGLNASYRDRYIVDALWRRDGSSLFGANARWANYWRGSAAWRLTQESWWFLPSISELKLRSSLGTAGGRPRFDAQYETFTLVSGGLLSTGTLGNKDLRPELTTELESGVDVELYRRIGLNVTYAQARTTGQLLLVPPSSATGFSLQWQNAGTLENRTWEASLNLPIIQRPGFTWSAQLNYDRNRSVITALNFPAYSTCAPNSPANVATAPCLQGTNSMFLIQVGERLGAIYGDHFMKECRELQAPFSSQCGAGKEWQRNDEGFIVWVGQGNNLDEGITRNLWQAERPGCISGTGAGIDAIGVAACKVRGGTVNTPNAVSNDWGNPILLRDSTGTAVSSKVGNALPDFRVSLSQTMTVRRLAVYALLDASVGNDVWNQGRHFAFGDFQAREQDQAGKTVETAKPIGHFWRGGAPDDTRGTYGLFNVLRPNNFTTENASYAKIRELSVAYAVGAVRGRGDWTISLIARNLYTFTRYTGFDPEVGRAGGDLGSGALNAVDAFQYPSVRTFTMSIATRL